MEYIDVNRISKTEMSALAYGLLNTLTEFFRDPENQEGFREWCEERKQKSA